MLNCEAILFDTEWSVFSLSHHPSGIVLLPLKKLSHNLALLRGVEHGGLLFLPMRENIPVSVICPYLSPTQSKQDSLYTLNCYICHQRNCGLVLAYWCTHAGNLGSIPELCAYFFPSPLSHRLPSQQVPICGGTLTPFLFQVFNILYTFSICLINADVPCSSYYATTCGDGTCVNYAKNCDGTNDCNDGADEADCRKNILIFLPSFLIYPRDLLMVRGIFLDCWSLPCLLQCWTWFHISDYHNFWNSVSLSIKSLASNNCFSYRNFFKNGIDVCQK